MATCWDYAQGEREIMPSTWEAQCSPHSINVCCPCRDSSEWYPMSVAVGVVLVLAKVSFDLTVHGENQECPPPWLKFWNQP